MHGAHFRTMRRGFLGAFPGDGLTHPLLLRLAHELVAAAPRIFANYALALWWLFKYSETNPAGIGIHADPAAVNCNLWLTQDAACLDGGGLTVYSYVPELHTHTLAVNHEFADGEEAVTCIFRVRGFCCHSFDFSLPVVFRFVVFSDIPVYLSANASCALIRHCASA